MIVACFVGEYRGKKYSLSTDGKTDKELIQKMKAMVVSLGIPKRIAWKCLWSCGQAVRKKRKKKDSG